MSNVEEVYQSNLTNFIQIKYKKSTSFSSD